jgi:hypothetical protein
MVFVMTPFVRAPRGMSTMKIKAFTILLALIPILSASAAPALSGTYTGYITFTPKDGATSYQDRNAKLTILPDTGKGVVAVVNYSDQLGHYREKCSVTLNSDGTLTLKGFSYTILAGTSFSLDTFKIQVAADGSISGNSIDTGGGTSILSFHH